MTLQTSPDLLSSIAVTRFGLGARPGEIEAARSDPQGYLLAQIRREGADQPSGDLPDAAASFDIYREDRKRIQVLKADAASAEERSTASGRPPEAATMSPRPPEAMEAADMSAPVKGDALKRDRRRILQPLRQMELAEVLARSVLGAGTPAGFRERWTLFWANHFTVSASKPQVAALAGPFEREAVRPHVFGRFEDLLVASSTHPGMLFYLDQARSVGPLSVGGRRNGAGLNENLGREILELHTVGADAGYTQADVTEFARALTGLSVARANEAGRPEGTFFWRAAIHEPGPRTVMGRRYPDTGEAQALNILKDLASDPRTSRRLARKIAVHFVSDDPPPALIARLDEAYMRSGGDLAVVAKILVTSPEAWAPGQAKFKTPNDFIVSAWRAAGYAPQSGQEAAQALQLLGQRPFAAPQPNGWAEVAEDWASGGAVMRRLGWAASFSGSHAPPGAPLETADAVLGSAASPALKTALARAETRQSAFALLLMSPEFQRR